MAPAHDDYEEDDRDRDRDRTPDSYERRAAALHLDSIESRMRQLDARTLRLEEWRLGAMAMIDAVPEIRTKLEQQERTDAIEAGVAEGLRKAEVRGWGKRERFLTALGGAGIVASIVLQVIQTVTGR